MGNFSRDMFEDSGSSVNFDPYHLSQSAGAGVDTQTAIALSISEVCFIKI